MEEENLGSHGNLSLPNDLMAFIGKAIKDESIAKVLVRCNVFVNPYGLTEDINSQVCCPSFAWFSSIFFSSPRETGLQICAFTR